MPKGPKGQKTLRLTPAMAAGIADKFWTLEDNLWINRRVGDFR